MLYVDTAHICSHLSKINQLGGCINIFVYKMDSCRGLEAYAVKGCSMQLRDEEITKRMLL